MVLGSYAEYLLIPARIARLNVFKKPAHLSFALASLLEPLACVAQGILEFKKAGAFPADSTLVIGPGAIGLMFVRALRASGVERVVLAGRNPDRLAVGASLGAETIPWNKEGKGDYDLVVECTGQPEVWEASVNFARRGGRVMLFGGCPSGTNVSFSTSRLHYDQITLLSPFHFGTAAVLTAKSWLDDPVNDFSPLISGTRTLAQAGETFADLEAGRGIKFVFQP
jgi:L-iditol 2-dehydrogenase